MRLSGSTATVYLLDIELHRSLHNYLIFCFRMLLMTFSCDTSIHLDTAYMDRLISPVHFALTSVVLLNSIHRLRFFPFYGIT